MDPPTHLSLILLVFSWLVQDVCNKTSYYSFCIEAYEFDPRTPSASTLLHLVRIVMELGKANATDTRSHISDMYRRVGRGSLVANYDVFIADESAGQFERRLASNRVQDTWISMRNNFS
ncbi:hypothetical protein AAG906_000877 [Vitis piasezkii]